MADVFSENTLCCDYRGCDGRKVRLQITRTAGRYLRYRVDFSPETEHTLQPSVCASLDRALAAANEYHEVLCGRGWRMLPAGFDVVALLSCEVDARWAW